MADQPAPQVHVGLTKLAPQSHEQQTILAKTRQATRTCSSDNEHVDCRVGVSPEHGGFDQAGEKPEH